LAGGSRAERDQNVDPAPAGGSCVDIRQLVADHHAVVYTYAYRLTGSVADAEDLTQQVFLQAQNKLHQLREPRAARTWLYAILRNSFRKQCRQRSVVTAADLELDVDRLPDEHDADEALDRQWLQEALDQLTPEHRIILAMFYFEDCAYREIAEALELPMGTVMSRLARAKRQLRAKLFPTQCPEAAQ
jgi:RNA polymerase sigma-70 factor (ECF subfamily)